MSEILRLQSSWSYYPADGGGTELACIPRGIRRRLTLAHEPIDGALEALVDGVPADDATAAIVRSSGLTDAQAERLLDELTELGALVRRDPSDDISTLDGTTLYDRQIRFLSFYEDAENSGPELNRRLQDRTVLIPGLGGLGGWIALLCARMGVRRIIGVDPDTIELSNLHRQVLYTAEDIGRLKVDACARALRCVDPEIEFAGHALWIAEPHDVTPLLDGVDLVINAFPYLPSFRAATMSVAKAAVLSEVPCLNMFMPQCLGPLTIPGVTACVQCYLDHSQTAIRLDALADACTPVGTRRRGFLGALAPRQAIFSGLAAWEATRFLSGADRPPTLDGLVFIDIGAYGKHHFRAIPRNPDCSVCGHLTDGDALDGRFGEVAATDPDPWRAPLREGVPG
jgi:hypothetical protein